MPRNHFLPIFSIVILFSLWYLDCRSDNPLAPVDPFLDVQFVSGWMSANLMPVVPPDPISAQIIFTARNTHISQSMVGLKVVKADVYLNSNNQSLGTIRFSSTWDGRLEPGEMDTVTATKIQSSTKLFDPPCIEYVYLTIFVGTDSSNATMVITDSLIFTCVY